MNSQITKQLAGDIVEVVRRTEKKHLPLLHVGAEWVGHAGGGDGELLHGLRA